jgi:hypothetical protein
MTTPTVRTASAQLRQSAAIRGRGWTTLEKLALPAAGGGLTYPIDGTYWRRLLSLAATLTTSATAGQRALNLAYLDGDGFAFNVVPILAQVSPGQAIPIFADQAQVSPVPGSGINPAPTVAAASAAAAGTATATLPLLNAITGFDVTVGGVAVNTTSLITVTGVQGGTLTYTQLSTTTNTDNVQVRFPQPLQPAAAGTAIAVTFTGSANSPPLTIVAYGSAPLVSAQVQLPDFMLKSGWQLALQLTGAQAGDQLSGIGLLFERYPSSDTDVLSGDRGALIDQLAAALSSW